MNNVLVLRGKDQIIICETDLTYNQHYILCHAMSEANTKRLLTVNTDATYIGTKNIREYSDQEIVDALLWNRGFKVMTNPEVANAS